MRLNSLHPNLKALLVWLEDEAGVRLEGFGFDREFTARVKPEEMGRAIEFFVNKNWIYDPDSPELKCCLMDGGRLRFQVHKKTRPR